MNSVTKTMKWKGKFIPFFIFSLFFFVGCTENSSEDLPEKEYDKFGQQIAYAFNSNQLTFIKKRFLQQQIYDRLLLTLDSLDMDPREYDKGASVKKQLLQQYFDEQLEWISATLQDNSFRFIGYQKSGKPRLLFGIQLGDYMDFMEFEVTSMNERIYLIDFFRYYSGIRYSDYYIWNEINREFYGEYGGPFMDALDQLYNASVYLDKGQPDRALIAFNRIPEEFAFHPRFHVVKQQIAQSLGDSLMEQVFYEKIGYHWDEPRTRYTNLISYYRYFNMPDTSLIYLDSLEIYTGENYLIDTLRSKIMITGE